MERDRARQMGRNWSSRGGRQTGNALQEVCVRDVCANSEDLFVFLVYPFFDYLSVCFWPGTLCPCPCPCPCPCLFFICCSLEDCFPCPCPCPCFFFCVVCALEIVSESVFVPVSVSYSIWALEIVSMSVSMSVSYSAFLRGR